MLLFIFLGHPIITLLQILKMNMALIGAFDILFHGLMVSEGIWNDFYLVFKILGKWRKMKFFGAP